MNDLEPWKIWAVTGILAAMIMGSAVIRVRPMALGETSALAGTLIPNETAPGSAGRPAHAADQDDVNYFSVSPNFSAGSFNRSEYLNLQASANRPAQSLQYASNAQAVPTNYDNQEPILDVARELLGNAASQIDTSASIDDQPAANTELAWFAPTDDQALEALHRFGDSPTDDLAYVDAPDGGENNVTFSINSIISNVNGNSTVLLVQDGNGAIQVANVGKLGLSDEDVQAAANGGVWVSNTMGATNLNDLGLIANQPQAINDSYLSDGDSDLLSTGSAAQIRVLSLRADAEELDAAAQQKAMYDEVMQATMPPVQLEVEYERL